MTAIPETMHAAAIDRPGDTPLALTSDAGEVLIALHTAGVCGWDADIRGGWA
ncbi:MAG: hypothetical protein QOF70_3190 [Acetobacteraceae bacterium]|nr:hypothetical protein [Acetobacteraceae bacterium]